MATEIERKFLVINDSWRAGVESESHVMQGYLSEGKTATVRVRIKGDAAFLTIKGKMQGISRSEYEYPIPVADAEPMLRELSVSTPIDKTRYQRALWRPCLGPGPVPRRERRADHGRGRARAPGRALRDARPGQDRRCPMICAITT